MEHSTPENLHTLFINLNRAPERRSFMETQLNASGLSFQRLEATDGQKNDLKDYAEPTRLSRGELACAHSHQRALLEFLNSNKKWGLIVEDDTEIPKEIKSVIENVLQSLQNQIDKPIYVQFDYAPVGWKGIHLWWFLFFNLIKNNKNNLLFWLKFPFYILKGAVASTLLLLEGVRNKILLHKQSFELIKTKKDRYLAGFYLLSKSAAKELIEINTPMQYAADTVHNLARKQNKIKHYIYSPRIIRQKREGFPSYLNNDNFGKDVISY